MPRVARAALMGRGSTDVRFVTCVVNRDYLNALAALLESGDVRVVIDKIYALGETANAVGHMLGHHARERSSSPCKAKTTPQITSTTGTKTRRDERQTARSDGNTQLRIRDGVTIARRNVIKNTRVPEILVGVQITPLIFVILFASIRGAARASYPGDCHRLGGLRP
jgi:hypothetical protein